MSDPDIEFRQHLDADRLSSPLEYGRESSWGKVYELNRPPQTHVPGHMYLPAYVVRGRGYYRHVYGKAGCECGWLGDEWIEGEQPMAEFREHLENIE